MSEGLIIDIVAILFALGVAIIGVAAIAHYWKLTRAADLDVREAQKRERGEHNVLEFRAELNRRCSTCNELTDPTVDFCLDGQWLHKKCFWNQSKEKGN